ncbi:hypothetical protein DPMN_161966 [Dreissena polymorpha]|uniref:Uncharacterized protein n=1 Tax=Dreissena polymorpha TaxID=45954 RepID=A0A9D4ET44_DREPO|nr:hypothetical protein DPMN_161966 [Dreissena polymorpha]
MGGKGLKMCANWPTGGTWLKGRNEGLKCGSMGLKGGGLGLKLGGKGLKWFFVWRMLE